jgi:hypothetical protein
MRNKQPFYHRAVILFTGTREFSRDEMTKLLAKKLKSIDIVKDSPECEEIDAEPGDPADLL